jgi:hypothetical protein
MDAQISANPAVGRGPTLPTDVERIISIRNHRPFASSVHPGPAACRLARARVVSSCPPPSCEAAALYIFRIEPFLYRIIYVSSSGMMAPHCPSFTFDLLLRLMCEKSASFFKTSVDHLLIDDMFSAVEAASLCTIFACSGVNDFFINASVSPLLPLFCGFSSLRILGVSLQPLFGDLPIDFTHHLFTNITHLDIFDRGTNHIAEGLALIPNLTHCAFNSEVFLDKTPHILQTCPKLQYLISVIWWATEFDEFDEKRAHCAALALDVRFVVVVRDHFRADWLSGAQYGRISGRVRRGSLR